MAMLSSKTPFGLSANLILRFADYATPCRFKSSVVHDVKSEVGIVYLPVLQPVPTGK
jgi:hypothetical protein